MSGLVGVVVCPAAQGWTGRPREGALRKRGGGRQGLVACSSERVMLARTLAAQLSEVDAVSVERGRRVVVSGRWEDWEFWRGIGAPAFPAHFGTHQYLRRVPVP